MSFNISLPFTFSFPNWNNLGVHAAETAGWLLIMVILAPRLIRFIFWLFFRVLTPKLLPQKSARTAFTHNAKKIILTPANFAAATLSFEGLAFIYKDYPATSDIFTRIAFTCMSFAIVFLISGGISQIYLVPGKKTIFAEQPLHEHVTVIARTLLWGAAIFLAIIADLQIWGFDASGLLTGTGLIGLALSLAARDTAENLLGYFVIVMERPFIIGDAISTGTVTGTVELIGWRSTRIRQLNQALVNVPNRNLTSANTYNYSRMNKQNITFTLYLPYMIATDNITTLINAIRDAIIVYPLVNPASVEIVISALERDSIDLTISCAITDADTALFAQRQHEIYLTALRAAESARI